MNPTAHLPAAPLVLGAGELAHCSVFSPLPGHGNPTVVMRLSAWPATSRLAELAQASGVAETTFVVLEDGVLDLRWFAGSREVPLCGHGALAAAAVLGRQLPAGELHPVRNLPGRLWLSCSAHDPMVAFRAAELRELPVDEYSLGMPAVRLFDAGRDLLVVLADEAALHAVRADAPEIARLPKIGCIVSAPSGDVTAAFRFFAPRAGIAEDRASGSVIPALVACWATNGNDRFEFRQCSGWDIRIRARREGTRVLVGGEVVELARHAIADGTPRPPVFRPWR